MIGELQPAGQVGRQIIDLERALTAKPDWTSDLVLCAGDHLRIPRIPQAVTVLGDGQDATFHLCIPSLTPDDSLSMSAGATRSADEKRMNVICASDSIGTVSGNRWRRLNTEMSAAGAIVAELDAERVRPLPLWAIVRMSLYNVVISVAAVNSF